MTISGTGAFPRWRLPARGIRERGLQADEAGARYESHVVTLTLLLGSRCRLRPGAGLQNNPLIQPAPTPKRTASLAPSAFLDT